MNKREETEASREHTLHLQNREILQVNGVNEVVSFDETSVLLRTTLGMLSVCGEDLKVRQLDTERGLVVVEGRLSAMLYSEEADSAKRGRGGGIGRLFR